MQRFNKEFILDYLFRSLVIGGVLSLIVLFNTGHFNYVSLLGFFMVGIGFYLPFSLLLKLSDHKNKYIRYLVCLSMVILILIIVLFFLSLDADWNFYKVSLATSSGLPSLPTLPELPFLPELPELP